MDPSSIPSVRLRDVLAGLRRTAHKGPRAVLALRSVLRADPEARLSLPQLVARNARRWPDAPALLAGDARWTWSALDRRANELAHGLRRCGVGAGDVVVLLVAARPELLLLLVALGRLNATAGLVNIAAQREALRHAITVNGPARIVVGEELAGSFEEVRGVLPPLGAPIYLGDEQLDGTPRIPAPCPGGWCDLLSEAAEGSGRAPLAARDVRAGDRAFLIPTSGTTGLPKASVMTHGRFLKAADVMGRALLDVRVGDVVYVPLPFFHNMALSVGFGAALATGAATAMRRKLSITSFWDDCVRYRATVFPYIGELPRYLLEAPPTPRDRSHSVRAVVGVGLRGALWAPLRERFGIDEIHEIYSASEANLGFVNPFQIAGTVGFTPLPHALLAWDADAGVPRRGPDGRCLRAPRGEPGLLVGKVTARTAFDGYTDPGATEGKLLRDVFAPGDSWFNSGDLLQKVGWGHAVFIDRVGDTFRWRSENVSTMQVETAVREEPAVMDCAVYGVSVPGAPGRAGMAAVVVRSGAVLDVAGLGARLATRLPEPAVPVFLRIVEVLPSTATHKTQKGALRDAGWEGAHEVWFRPPRGTAYVALDAGWRARLAAGTLVF